MTVWEGNDGGMIGSWYTCRILLMVSVQSMMSSLIVESTAVVNNMHSYLNDIIYFFASLMDGFLSKEPIHFFYTLKPPEVYTFQGLQLDSLPRISSKE